MKTLLFLTALLPAQTVIWPDQIRNWSQVANRGGLAVSQIRPTESLVSCLFWHDNAPVTATLDCGWIDRPRGWLEWITKVYSPTPKETPK